MRGETEQLFMGLRATLTPLAAGWPELIFIAGPAGLRKTIAGGFPIFGGQS